MGTVLNMGIISTEEIMDFGSLPLHPLQKTIHSMMLQENTEK